MECAHHSYSIFVCTLCGKTCTRSLNLEMHMRTCTGVASTSTPSSSSTPAHRGGAAFTIRRKRRALGGAKETHVVDMNARNQLAALRDAVLSLEPTMDVYQRGHQAYKYQVALDVVFHKAVDPAVVTVPPVTLRCDMVAVYPGGSPQLAETSARLLELVEVYEHNGSGGSFPVSFRCN